MARKSRWGYWWPPVVWAAIIFWFSARPTITTTEIYWQDFVLKKMAHFGVYAVLAGLLYRAIKHTTRLDRISRVVVTLAVTAMYAILDEFHQSFIPGRDPQMRDVIIDVVGAMVALRVLDK